MNRSDRWLSFPSITYANKAKKLLQESGISTRMERIPQSVRGKSCGYRLAVTAAEYDKARAICEQNKIRMTESDRMR